VPAGDPTVDLSVGNRNYRKAGLQNLGLEYHLTIVTVDGYEVPKIKEAGKEGYSVLVPVGVPLILTVEVERDLHTGFDPKLIAEKAAKSLAGVVDREQKVTFTIPALLPPDVEVNEVTRYTRTPHYRLSFDDGDGILSDGEIGLNDISKIDQGLFGKQALVLTREYEGNRNEEVFRYELPAAK
jgi:hypothetical protein